MTGTSPLHRRDGTTAAITRDVVDYVVERMAMSPPPLDAPRTPAELAAATGTMITPDGLGHERAFALFRDVLAPACISSDHPRYLSFVPTAPSKAATLFDLVVSASSIYGDWWVEGAGAIYAENVTLRWLADLADASAAAFWEVLACLRRTRGQGASADPNADAAADVGERRNDSPSDGSSTGSSSLTSGLTVWTG